MLQFVLIFDPLRRNIFSVPDCDFVRLIKLYPASVASGYFKVHFKLQHLFLLNVDPLRHPRNYFHVVLKECVATEHNFVLLINPLDCKSSRFIHQNILVVKTYPTFFAEVAFKAPFGFLVVFAFWFHISSPD